MRAKFIIFAFFLFINLTVFGSILTVSNSSDAGIGSLRAQINLAVNGDEIRFSPSLLSGGSNTIVLLSQIAFSKNLTITGLYDATDTLYLSGGGTNRIFQITNAQSVVLDSLFFMEGFVNGHGGAVAVNEVDSFFVTNCFFHHNKAIAPFRGGGLSVRGTSYTISEVNNTLISNCYFTDNSSGYGGGFASNSSAAYPNIVNIENSSFMNNTADYGGGILYDTYTSAVSTQAAFLLSNCTIANNIGVGYGGGVWIASQSAAGIEAKIMDSKIYGNSGSNSGGGVYYYNGSETEGSLLVQNSEIENNIALNGAGIFYSLNSDSSIVSQIKIVKSSISKNIGALQGGGGGIFVANSGISLGSILFQLEESTLEGNSVNSSGINGVAIQAVFFNNNSEIHLKNSTITNNISPSGLSGSGIDTYGDSALIEITSSILSNNGSANISSPLPIISGGYNIFSDSLVSGSVATDQLNVDTTQLKLSALSYNGGFTKTRLPLSGSFAVDAGNSLDFTNAQNAPVYGKRDVGAAESCLSSFIDYQTDCNSFTWINGNTYNASSNSTTIVLPNAIGCDSVVRLDLKIFNNSTTISLLNQNTLVVNQTGDSLQWINCNNGFAAVAGANQGSFVPTSLGNYACIVYQNNCIDTSACFLFTSLPVQLLNKQKIDFFPNPSFGVVHILADEIIELVQVFDMMGKQIASSKGSSTNFNLDLASYPLGKYIVKVQMSSKVEIFSVVKSD